MSKNEISTIQSRQGGLKAFIDSMQSRMAAVLPKHLTAERMARVVLVETSRNPKLLECTTSSFAASLMLASQLGLEPSSPLGHFYLIPRWNKKVRSTECTALVGYKGLLELMRRSGEVARANAGVFYEAELARGAFTFTHEPPVLEHKGIFNFDRSDDKLAGAYAVVETRDGCVYQVVLDREQIEDRRKRSAAAGGFSPWSTDYAAMCRKTAIRALLNSGMVPLSAELVSAIKEDADATPAERGEVIDVRNEADPAPTSGTQSARAALGLQDDFDEDAQRAAELEALPSANEIEHDQDDDSGSPL